MRARLAIAIGLVWLAAGLLGTWSYAHNYYIYRGFTPPHDPKGVSSGRAVSVKFYSRALRQTRAYWVYLPPGYDAGVATGKRFPVLYLLHGSPGFPMLFVNAGHIGVELDTLIAHHQVRPFLIVMPNGRNGSYRSDTEWANTRHGHYESFVRDVVHAVDARWATVPDRGHRALAGDSEGAYGAINVALRNLRLFGTAEVWSGYFSQTATGPFKHASFASLWANSPVDYVPQLAHKLKRYPFHAFLYTGNRDKQRHKLGVFVDELRRAGGHAHYAIYPGRHSWRLWRDQAPHMLRYANARFRAADAHARHLRHVRHLRSGSA
jgi:enterochelin esterase-like enzyme